MKLTTFARLSLACTALSLAAFAGACNKSAKAEADEAECKTPKAGVTTVNKVCVVEPEDFVNPDVPAADFKGQKVGFCCKGCVPKWNKMTDAQKDAALAAAIAAGNKK